jgi:two-component system sensor histidine kinase CpxA
MTVSLAPFGRAFHSLATRAMLLALFNALLVLLWGTILIAATYNRNLIEFLRAPVGEKILTVSRKVSLDLLENESESWDSILRRESDGTPFRLELLDSHGKRLAGEQLDLPKDVQEYANNLNSALSNTPKFDAYDRPSESFLKQGNFYIGHDRRTGLNWASSHLLIHFVDGNMYGHGTLVWCFSGILNNPYFFTSRPYLALLAGALLITALCWIPAVGLLLRRVSKLTAATREIAEGKFESRLPAKGKDEIGQLVESVAIMSRQISGLLHQHQRFASDAAHELCSPIARIQMAAELLRERLCVQESTERGTQLDRLQTQTKPDATALQYLSDITEDTEQMSELVKDLLLYSRTRDSKEPIDAQTCQLASLVRSVLKREGLDEKGMRIDVPDSLQLIVPVTYLRRALANLLRNAQLYAGEAGPVEISAYQDGSTIRIIVRDQGPGIPEKELERVFAPFYRIETSRSRDTGGTGLGLAIVRSSIDACNGSVVSRNRNPHGLEIEIALPVDLATPISQEELASLSAT